jgi:hypothetical protein
MRSEMRGEVKMGEAEMRDGQMTVEMTDEMTNASRYEG